MDLPDRVWDRILVEPNTGHWFWLGALSRLGYGRIGVDGTQIGIHRYVYSHLVSPIPAGKVIDHICRVRNCVAPNHLRVVTPAQNAMENSAGFCPRRAAADHCERGHPYSEGRNLIITKTGQRLCRICRNVYMRDLMRRRRVAQGYSSPYEVSPDGWALPRKAAPR